MLVVVICYKVQSFGVPSNSLLSFSAHIRLAGSPSRL